MGSTLSVQRTECRAARGTARRSRRVTKKREERESLRIKFWAVKFQESVAADDDDGGGDGVSEYVAQGERTIAWQARPTRTTT